MRKNFFTLSVISLFAFVFFSCGGSADATKASDHSSSSEDKGQEIFIPSVFDTLLVANQASLPSCNPENAERGYFAKAENTVFVCSNSEWIPATAPDINIHCKNGFIRTTETAAIANTGTASLHGNAAKGPFLFGSSVTVSHLDSSQFYRSASEIASHCIISQDGRYQLNGLDFSNPFVQVSVNGYIRNEVNGRYSESPITLEAIADMTGRDSLNVNILSHLSLPRIQQLAMNHIPFTDAKSQAEREVFAAFGIDTAALYSQFFANDAAGNKIIPHAEDLTPFGSTEFNAALFAISLMVQGNRSAEELSNLLQNIAEDLKGDGTWNNQNDQAKIADWIIAQDTAWKYNEFRNAISAWGINLTIPNFERYLKNFWSIAYNFGACTDTNAGKVTFINNSSSAFFAGNYTHTDVSRIRFICDINSKSWRIANDIEKDTAGFGNGEYDREIREGQINFDKYYIFEKTTSVWREATPAEADGFTEIADVYNNLKADETVVFIMRHAERTDDTSEKGHLTDNGKKQAQGVGAKIKGESAYYGYSGFTRTQETVEGIASGRGESKATFNVLSYLDGNWFIKDKEKFKNYQNSNGGWMVIAKYAYDGEYADAFYELEPRAKELLTTIKQNLSSQKRVNIFCTHDLYMVPLLVYVTNGHANVHYPKTRKWLNYLAGLAIIYSADGSVRYIPIKGLETGTM